MGMIVEKEDYGKWLPWSYDPVTEKRVFFCETEDTVVFRTETPVDQLVEENKASYNESDGKRWGDGKVVASIDLPTYYNKIVPAKNAGDDRWIKRFLNDADNRGYRTFKGNI